MPTLPPANLVVEPILPGHCSNVFITWDQPADADATSDIVGGGTYSAGIKVVAVIPGKMYHFIKGANDTSLVNGTETWNDSIYFLAQGATVTLNGAGAVTGVIRTMLVQTYRVYRDRQIIYEMPAYEHQNQQPIVDPDRHELTFYTYRVDAIDSSGGIASSPLAAVIMPECTPNGYPVQFGTFTTDAATASTVDSSGNVLIASVIVTGLSRLLFLAKLNTSAEFVWVKYFPIEQPVNTNGSALISSIATDGVGNVFISGQFNGRIDLGDGWVNGTNLFAQNQGIVLEVFFAKFNSSGALQFKVVKAGLGDWGDYRSRIALFGTDIFICGVSATLGNGVKGFFEKYNALGVLQWTHRLDTSNIFTSVVDPVMVLNAAGDIIFTARNGGGTFDFGCGPLTATQSWIVLGRLSNADGSCVWAKAYGPTTPTRYGISPKNIALDSQENVIISGVYTLYGGNAGGSGDFPTGAFDGSPFVAKYSPAGVYIWSTPLVTAGGSSTSSVKVGDSDAIFMSGDGGGRIYFDNPAVPITYVGGWVAKYSSAGTPMSLTLHGINVNHLAIMSASRLAVIGVVDTSTKGRDIFVEIVNQ